MKKNKTVAIILVVSIALLILNGCQKVTKSPSASGSMISTINSDEVSTGISSEVSGESQSESIMNSTSSNSLGLSGSASTTSSSIKSSASTSGVFVNPTPPNISDDPLLKGVDLKGYNFKIIDFTGLWDRKTGVSKANDLRIKMLKEIETKLNCKITLIKATYGKFYQTYQPAILSGEKIADVISPTMYEIGSFISAGLLADIKKVPTINLSKPYWSQQFNKASTIKGKTYSVSCSLNSHLGAMNAIYFNKRLISELKLENPYKLVNDKKWTIDKFIEMCRAAKKGDERYGIAGPDWTKSISFFMGSGIKILSEANGKIVFNLKPSKTSPVNSAAVTYLNKLQTLLVKGDLCTPINAGQPWSVTIDQFSQGKTLFFTQMLGVVGNPDYEEKFANMKDDYGLVPMPSASVGSNYYNVVDWNSSVWGIPITNKDLSKSGSVLEAIAYHSYYDLNSASLNEFGDKYLRDDESMQMLKLIQNTGVYDLIFYAGIADTRIKDALDKIITMSCEVKGYDPAQAIPMYEDSIRKGVDAFFNS